MPPYPTQNETQSPRVPQRAQLEYPLDLESEGALKSALENVQKDVIHRSNRIQTTLLSGATSFSVASSYMVMTAQAAVTIATISGGREGMILTLQFTDGNITITDIGTGVTDTVNLKDSFTSSANDVLELLHDGISWREVSRSRSFNSATRTIILTAAGGAPTTTSGCGGPTKVEAGTNDIDYWALEFDTTTEERAFWNVQMPDNYDGGTVTARFIWTNASGSSTQTVVWAVKARAYADSDAIDQAYGSEVTVTDTWLAQGDVHISSATSAITIGGSPAGGQYVVFNIGRKTGSDNLTGDARLLAVQIEYTTNNFSD